jgi:hypothetical protein
MKRLFFLLPILLFGVALAPNNPPPQVTLQWDPSPDLAVTGYRIYYGTASSNYTSMVNVPSNSFGGLATTCTVSNLTRGVTYFFAATAYTGSGLESDFSNEVSYKVPTVPAPPQRVRIPTPF